MVGDFVQASLPGMTIRDWMGDSDGTCYFDLRCYRDENGCYGERDSVVAAAVAGDDGKAAAEEQVVLKMIKMHWTN